MTRLPLTALLLLAAGVANAAPTRIDAVYDLYRNGSRLGTVTDSLIVNGKHYTLTSVSRATGALGLLWSGTIKLESRGEVTADGLKPARFVHTRSDKPEKTASASFDWPAARVAFDYKARVWHETGLTAGTQDSLSQLYQFAWMKTLPAALEFQVVSGKNRKTYRYTARAGGTLETPFGRTATRLYERVGQDKDDKAVSVWVAPGKDNLPIRVKVVDEDGVTLEQRLVSLNVRG